MFPPLRAAVELKLGKQKDGEILEDEDDGKIHGTRK
jgi:hypothetical protein